MEIEQVHGTRSTKFKQGASILSGLSSDSTISDSTDHPSDVSGVVAKGQIGLLNPPVQFADLLNPRPKTVGIIVSARQLWAKIS